MAYIRHMKTTQERREIIVAEEQGIRVRAKRNLANIPESYDDTQITYQRSWKKYRRTRWK